MLDPSINAGFVIIVFSPSIFYVIEMLNYVCAFCRSLITAHSFVTTNAGHRHLLSPRRVLPSTSLSLVAISSLYQVIIKQNTFIKKLQSTVYGQENLWPLIDDHSDVGASYDCVGQRPLIEFRRFKCGPRNYETLVFSAVRQNT